MITYEVKTKSKVELVDISNKVRDAVSKSKIASGVCTVFVPHTTAAVTINENADPSVKADIIMELNKIVPFEDGYSHREGNSAAHIKTSLFGPSLNLLVERNEVVLGTWQGIYFCEFDGPRRRQFYVQIVGK
ncbi:MAG: YjbQ family protein [Thermoplasmata archaeon]|nr:MAG: YjbQ family protein [Thermoplasmata archaeon]